MTTYRQRVINGMAWSLSERLGFQVIQLVVSIVLARLLEPAQFGLVGMLTIFTALAQSLLDSGFGSALIQKKDANQKDASSIFFFNLFVGIILALVLFLAAPTISKFYSQPELIPITRVLSLNLIINGFSLVQTTLLNKNMEFKTQMKVGIISVILSGGIGIYLAFDGRGVWSLVVQMITNNFIRAILLWWSNKWRPTLEFSFTSLRSMFSFGSRLLLSGLIDTFFKNIYQLIIGKLFSAMDLGFFTRANSLQTAAVTATSSSLNQVTFSALAKYQDDDAVLRIGYRKTIRLSMFVHFPLMIGLFGIADPLIRFLMTDKWGPSVPYFQLLCVVGLFYPLHVLNLNILKVKGRSDLFLKLEIIKKICIVVAIFITFRWGITGLICGQIVTSIIAYFLNSYYSGFLINYPILNQVQDIITSFVTAIIMGFLLLSIGQLLESSLSINLLLLILIGSSFYLLLNWLIKSMALKELLEIIISTIISFKKV